MSVVQKVASYIVGTRFPDVPLKAIQKGKECLLDALGAMFGGAILPSSKLAAEFARQFFSSGKASILGTEYRVNPIGAVWANATSHSALDIDDAHGLAIGHPGAVIFAPALAISQAKGQVSGKQLLEAVIIAYEVSIRVASSRRSQKRFSYSTGSWGAFAAAAATGKLIGLTEQQMVQAFGITTAHHPLPPNRRMYLGFGMVKEATGWAAMTGTSAAFLASSGFTGMEPILDDPEVHDPFAFDDLGRKYLISDIGFKLYPSCRWNHVAIDLILAMRNDHQIVAEEVVDVTIRTFLKASQMSHPYPENAEDAQYSLPFLGAVALRYGQLRPSSFVKRELEDPITREIASRIRIELRPEFETLFPQKYPTAVKIRTRTGAYERYAEKPKGDPHDPLKLDDLVGKFRTLTKGIIGDSRASQIIDIALGIDEEATLARLDGLL